MDLIKHLRRVSISFVIFSQSVCVELWPNLSSIDQIQVYRSILWSLRHRSVSYLVKFEPKSVDQIREQNFADVNMRNSCNQITTTSNVFSELYGHHFTPSCNENALRMTLPALCNITVYANRVWFPMPSAFRKQRMQQTFKTYSPSLHIASKPPILHIMQPSIGWLTDDARLFSYVKDFVIWHEM